jgi:hypothetical protein
MNPSDTPSSCSCAQRQGDRCPCNFQDVARGESSATVACTCTCGCAGKGASAGCQCGPQAAAN